MKRDRICAVVLEDAARSYDKIYHYKVPENMVSELTTGMRVGVPFGSTKAPRTAWFLDFVENSPVEKLKSIKSVLDGEPVLDKNMFRLAKLMRERYFCSYGAAISVMLPSGMRIKREKVAVYSNGTEIPYSEFIDLSNAGHEHMTNQIDSGEIRIEYRLRRAASSKTLKAARPALPVDKIQGLIDSGTLGNIKRRKALETLLEYGEVTLSDFESYESISRNIIHGLEKKGYIEIFDKKIERFNIEEIDSAGIKRHELNRMQASAVDTISKAITKEGPDGFLLHGITGSGKTEVYLNLAERTLAEGKDVIVLVPEISLTPLMMKRFHARFPGKLAVLHSRLSMGERYDQWMMINDNKASIALGARSCLFAPFDNLGLIIIDEEHEPSFVSENTPRYRSMDVAAMRCSLTGAVMVAGSATPSTEDYHYFKKRNRVIELPERTGEGSLPEVEVVDMRDEISAGNFGVLSKSLKEKIAANIKDKGQTMLFLNRRGYSSFILCKDCGNTNICSKCDVPMTYHRNVNALVCHYCGKMKSVPDVCPECGSRAIQKHGIGTQKVEEEVRNEFPGASVIRMDSDSTGYKNSHMEILEKFKKEKTDILIGTQMIAKGHDFPDITLVGILAADTLMTGFDYTSQERAFQLITQAAGRAGRGSRKGTAVIQAYNTDSYAIEHGISHDYESFYERETKLRKAFGYPPFGDIAIMLFTSRMKRDAIDWASRCARHLSAAGIEVSSVEPAPVSRINNRYRYRLVANDRRKGVLRRAIGRMYIEVVLKKPSDVAFSVDMRDEMPDMET